MSIVGYKAFWESDPDTIQPVLVGRMGAVVTELQANKLYDSIGQFITAIPEYPIEATTFVYNNAAKVAFMSWGVPEASIIVCADHVGDRLIFKNGNYITIATARNIQFYLASDPETSIGGGVVDSTNAWVIYSDSPIAYDGNTYDTWSTYCTLSGVRGTYHRNSTTCPRYPQNWPGESFYANMSPDIGGDDPYNPVDPSGPGGPGDGTFDFDDTPIDYPDPPDIGSYDTGMINLYVPSAAQLRALAAYLWAGAFDVDNFKKIVADPMDAILGLSIVPVTAAQIGVAAGSLAVGNIGTGLSMPIASRQYVAIDCGTVEILPKYGAYLDFAPYSKLQLFLPYIGFVQISPDDCMNGTIGVRYIIDILSGMCVAFVKCNDHVLYELSGTCSCTCPVTAGQYQNIALTALRVASAGAITGAAAMAGNVGGVTAGIEDAANAIISSVKPEIERSGGFGGSSGLMGHQVPYLILTIPRMCRPATQMEEIGYPSYVALSLGDISGFASVDSIHIKGISGASDADLAEIEQLLKEGVIL